LYKTVVFYISYVGYYDLGNYKLTQYYIVTEQIFVSVCRHISSIHYFFVLIWSNSCKRYFYKCSAITTCCVL